MESEQVDLEWKDFFGSSVSLAPSLISIYDKRINDNGTESLTYLALEQSDQRKHPSSLRPNESNSSSKPSKKKLVTNGDCFCGFSKGDFSLTLDRRSKQEELRGRKFENRRSKSVENGIRLKKGETLNARLVCREIIETERIYVRDLNEIIKGYVRVMESKPDLISEGHVGILFGNMEQILTFHNELLKELIHQEDDVVLISDSFISRTSNFKIYSSYCTNYPKSQKILVQLLSNEETNWWMQEQQAILNHKLPLASYLLKPVQRILKYHLLFQNLLKSLDMCNGLESNELRKVSVALNCMSSVARYINEMKRIHDRNVKMREVLDLLVTCNPQVHLQGLGNLILEDKFQFGLKSLQHVMLFDKQILICKWKDLSNLVVKVQIPCSNLMLVETVSKSPLSFSIHPFTDPSLLFTIQAKNLEQKSIWCHEIRKVILGNFDAHIPDKARNIVMNLTPEVPSTERMDDGAFGQIEWRKSSRRCSVAIIPDINLKLPVKMALEKCKSHGEYPTRDENKQNMRHLPMSQSLFSVNDESMHNSSNPPFSTSSSTLTTNSGQTEWFDDGENGISTFESLNTLEASIFIDNNPSRNNTKPHRGCEVSCNDGSTNSSRHSTFFLRRKISGNDLSASGHHDYNDLSRRSAEISQWSSSTSEDKVQWSVKKTSIPKRTGSFHNSSIHSTLSNSSTSFRNTLMSLRDKLKKRSHSTDNHHHHHHNSTPRLQASNEDSNTEKGRHGPSHRLVSRFAMTSRKSRSSPDNEKSYVGKMSEEASLRRQHGINSTSTVDPLNDTPTNQQFKTCTATCIRKNCFSPPGESNILFIDDSDDG